MRIIINLLESTSIIHLTVHNKSQHLYNSEKIILRSKKVDMRRIKVETCIMQVDAKIFPIV